VIDEGTRWRLKFRPVQAPEQMHAIAAMAREIWYEYYVALIGRAQVDYMVENLQSFEAMQAQLREGYEYFLIERGEPAGPMATVGYLAVRAQPEEESLFLSKLYLFVQFRGTGAGRRALTFVEELASARGLTRVWLTVNKGNPSRFMYERAGFVTAAPVVIDIGGGFVMDDYRMEKKLA
jgi:diamine N-acetyltransferase